MTTSNEGAHWKPSVYAGRFVDERSRPGIELIRRVADTVVRFGRGVNDIRRVYDLGCGTGRFIPPIAQTFPQAEIVGVDSADSMLKEARAHESDRVQFVRASIDSYDCADADLLFSNAALQWLANHSALIPRLMQTLSVGGIFANQIPDDFNEPSHTLMTDVMRSLELRGAVPAGAADRLAQRQAAIEPSLMHYYRLLQPLSSHVDCWSTTYYHVFTEVIDAGADAERVHPIASFLKGSSLGYALSTIPADAHEEYLREYVRGLSAHYPTTQRALSDGRTEMTCVWQFTRLFMIAIKA